MTNGKKFSLRMAVLMLCLLSVSAILSSCDFISYLESSLLPDPATAERTERTPADITTEEEYTYPEETEAATTSARETEWDKETTKAPETTKRPAVTSAPETTKKPETTSPPETTLSPEQLDNIPDDVQNNVFLKNKNNGRCDELIGNVKITVLLINDDVSAWNDASLSNLSSSLSTQEKEIEKTAKSYGKQLEITFNFITIKISGDAGAGDYSDVWIEASAKAAGYSSLANMQKDLDSKSGVDSSPILFALNKAGRAYASSSTSKSVAEYLVVFSSDMTSFNHELYHVYGAKDFYYPEEVKTLAGTHLGDSVMQNGTLTDPLTAFIIGWDDEIDTGAYNFLKQTGYITQSYLDSENEKQSITGSVTNHRLSYGIYTGQLERGTPDGQGEIIYDEGGRYKGSFDGGSRHGEGTYTWENGSVYTGTWVNGIRSGKGKIVLESGTVYEGNWENDKYNGKGKMTWTDGSYYEGDFKDGERHGTGTYHYANGNVYVGPWVNCERNGEGTFTFASGTVYVGMFKDGQFNGKGKITWTDGSYYEGDFKNGDRHGTATYHYSDGSVYTGEFANGKRNGQGTYTNTKGFVYSGGWKDDRYNGYGEATYTDGGTYKGDFENGLRHGQGTYVYPAGHVYTGQWTEGSRTGKGTMKWSDNSSYDGYWQANKRHGYGKYINKDGQVFEGQWQNDVFQG